MFPDAHTSLTVLAIDSDCVTNGDCGMNLIIEPYKAFMTMYAKLFTGLAGHGQQCIAAVRFSKAMTSSSACLSQSNMIASLLTGVTVTLDNHCKFVLLRGY